MAPSGRRAPLGPRFITHGANAAVLATQPCRPKRGHRGLLSLPPPYSVYLQRLLAVKRRSSSASAAVLSFCLHSKRLDADISSSYHSVRRRSLLFKRLSQSAVDRCRRRVLSALVHSRDAAAPHAAVLLCFDSNVFLLLAQQKPRCRHLQQLSLPLRRAFLLPFGAANAKEHSSSKHHCFSNTVSLLLSQQAPGCLTVSQDAVIRCRRRDINSIKHHFFGNTAILPLLQQTAVPCCFHSKRTVFLQQFFLLP